MANIIGMAASSRTRPCNSSSTTGRATARWSSRSIFGTRTAKCRSIFRRPICGPWKSTAPAASTFRSSSTRRRRNSGTRCRRFLDQLPDACQDDPDVQFLCRGSAREGRDRRATEVPVEEVRNGGQDVRVLPRRRWRSIGRRATTIPRSRLASPAILELPHVSEAARIFDVHHGWANVGSRLSGVTQLRRVSRRANRGTAVWRPKVAPPISPCAQSLG